MLIIRFGITIIEFYLKFDYNLSTLKLSDTKYNYVETCIYFILKRFKKLDISYVVQDCSNYRPMVINQIRI